MCALEYELIEPVFICRADELPALRTEFVKFLFGDVAEVFNLVFVLRRLCLAREADTQERRK